MHHSLLFDTEQDNHIIMNITMVVFIIVLGLEETLLQTFKSSPALHVTGNTDPNGYSATKGCGS